MRQLVTSVPLEAKLLFLFLMKGPRWASRTMTRKALAGIALLFPLSGDAASCVSESSRIAVALRVPMTHREQTLHRMPVHISEFAPVAEPLSLPVCGDVRPPEALLTPDPTLHPQDDDLHVRVSFIVGSDGHVHSAFILDSGGSNEDQLILGAVGRWRYRPALCNGVPTDSEARVRFTLR